MDESSNPVAEPPHHDVSPLIPFLYRNHTAPPLSEEQLREWFLEHRGQFTGLGFEGPVSEFEGSGNAYLADHQFNANTHVAPPDLPPIDAVRELYAAAYADEHGQDPADHTKDRSLLHRALHRCGYTHG